MDTNLKSYVKVYNDWLDKDLCDHIISNIADKTWQKQVFHDPLQKVNYSPSGEQELYISNDEIPEKEILMKRIWWAYKRYLNDINFVWFNHWQAYSRVRFNRYEENQRMENHCDHIHTLFDGERRGVPILTALCVLNDNYSGGEFIMWETEQIPLKAGDVVIFPSNFLYPHKVEMVTSGVRYSAVSWAW